MTDLQTLHKLQDDELAYLAGLRLYAFIHYLWPVLHDGREIIPTKHIPLMCLYLEAVASGRINRLVICIPPGFAKSLTVSVFYPAWRWVKDPSRQITSFSAANSVAVRDSVRTRRVLESERYKKVMAAHDVEFSIRTDQNQKTNFELTRGGFRKSFSMSSKSFGERSHEQITDDGHDAQDAMESPNLAVKRFDHARDTFEGKMADRLNDLNEGPRIVIGQRLYPNDIPGHCIDQGYVHLVLPMRYDPEHPHCSPDDWRTEPGELLCPAIANAETVADLFTKPLAMAKLQQLPEADGGKLFESSMFMVDTLTREEVQKQSRRCVISVDPTGGGGEGSDPAAMTVWLEVGGDRSICVEVSNEAIGWESTKDEFWRLVKRWRCNVAIIENSALGPALISEAQARRGLYVVPFNPSAYGGKYARLQVSVEYWRKGQMKLAADDGGFETLIAQHVEPEKCDHDDIADTCSQYAIWRFHDQGRAAPKREGGPKKVRTARVYGDVSIGVE